MTTAPAHEVSLLLASRCRRCAERLPGGVLLRAGACSRCGEAAVLRAEERTSLLAQLEDRAGRHLLLASAAAAGGALVLGWFPLLATLLLAGGMLWVSVAIVRPGARLLSARRRLVARLTLRLAAGGYLAASLVALELLTLLPVVGVLVKSVGLFGQVAFAGWSARRYLGWQAAREVAQAPVSFAEYALLAAAAVALTAAVAGLVLAAAWLAQQVGWLHALLLKGGAA